MLRRPLNNPAPRPPGVVFLLVVVVLLLPAVTSQAEEPSPPGEVMLVGVFHFANPGRDLVKTEVIDVMSAENQAYLEGLTDRLAAWRPTAVLLEFDPQNQAQVQSRYEQYRAGTWELGYNEIYQLGFRIARKAGLTEVHSFDERSVQWDAQALMTQMEAMPARMHAFEATIAATSKEQAEMHASWSLSRILHWHNSPAADRANKGLYLQTSDIGAGEGFAGADAAASWWHRNFRMYANIQRHAPQGSRVIAIGGQGHTAILRDLLADDPGRVAADVRPLLEP